MRIGLKSPPATPAIGRPLLAASAFAGMLMSALAGAAAEPVALHGRTMGTTYNVRYWTDAADAPSPPELQRTIDALLARFEMQMSNWRPDSELSLFNAAPSGEWFAVSPDVAAVVSRALELHRITDGASDVTVGPVSALWGFGPRAAQSGDVAVAPGDAELAAAMQCVGADNIEVREEPPALRKSVDGAELDLSSIAPGYAVDLVVDLLASARVENAMVDIGGEVRGVGRRSDGKPWQVGVRAPPPREHAIERVVPLANLALATSGDFHNVRTIDGVAYAHIIDPRTGQPLLYCGMSVTVVAETCFEADGVATALCVMGPDAGFQWCVEHRTAALFLDNDPATGAARSHPTPRFEEMVDDE